MDRKKMSKIIKALKSPEKILPYLIRKLKLTEKARTSNNGERSVVYSWKELKKSQGYDDKSNIFRYEWVARHISEKVIELGCGSGYGTAFLKSFCKSIVGVDYSEDAINFAKKYYGDFFIKANVLNLKLGKGKGFDTVVSLDLLEHLTANEQEIFMMNIVNLLRDDGKLILICPNRLTSKNENNKFHKNELDKKQLEKLLKRYFSDVKITGQIFKDNKFQVSNDFQNSLGLMAICEK